MNSHGSPTTTHDKFILAADALNLVAILLGFAYVSMVKPRAEYLDGDNLRAENLLRESYSRVAEQLAGLCKSLRDNESSSTYSAQTARLMCPTAASPSPIHHKPTINVIDFF